jgi:hypothetical protein
MQTVRYVHWPEGDAWLGLPGRLSRLLDSGESLDA